LLSSHGAIPRLNLHTVQATSTVEVGPFCNDYCRTRYAEKFIVSIEIATVFLRMSKMATNIAKTRRCLDPAGVPRPDGLQAQAPEAAFASSPMPVMIPNARLFAVYLPQKEGEEPCPFLPASIRRRPPAISDEMGK
jgi:hypothetical protein